MSTWDDALDHMEADFATWDIPDAVLGGFDRRQFMFRSLVSAAAGALGAAAAPSLLFGQGADSARRTTQQQQPTPVPLGNGESPALQFMPYPGGTGALMEKLARERGRAAFDRAVFSVEAWRGPVPASPEDIAYLPAHRLAALIKARRVTSAQLTEIYLDRLKRLNPTLNCLVTLLETQARTEAAQADAEIRAGRYRGPLHGLPYGLKDLFSTKGVPTTWGAKDFEDRVIDEDAEIVVRLRNAGAVLIAKLSTGLFAQNDQWFRGRTNNPWNLAQGSSGSSAGPGSATAAGCVAFAIGTETQGSIVSPTIRNGLCALRPTFGRVSRHGGMVLAWSMDRVGPMCRSMEDCAMVFNVLHGVDEKDPSTVTTPFQFTRSIDLASLRIGADAAAPKEFTDALRDLGVQFRTVGPRPTVAGASSGLGAEGAAAFDAYVQRKAKEIGLDLAALPEPAPQVPGGPGGGGAGGGAGAGGGGGTGGNPMAPADWNPRFVNGRRPRAFDFVQSQRRRYLLITAWAEYMKDLDMFIGAPSADVGANAQTGHPCVVLPYKFDVPPQGGPGGGGGQAQRLELKAQPVCATIVGSLYCDDRILSVAHRFQRVTDFHLRRPEL